MIIYFKMSENISNVDVQAMSLSLRQTMYSCFTVTEPYWGDHPSPLFHSHFDWHSSVHGHWAFLCASRMNGLLADDPLVSNVLRRFSVEALTVEREYLLKKSTFELPYGQSWLILLLGELAHWFTDTNDILSLLRELLQETLDRVVLWLAEGSYPDGHGGNILWVIFHVFCSWLNGRITVHFKEEFCM
jgi:hypothetical protein